MKKPWKVGRFVLAVSLFIVLGYFLNILTGYPIDYFVVKHSLNIYMEEHYAGTDFSAENPKHSLKKGGFFVQVNSPSSPDTKFELQFRRDGSLVYDSYENDVKTGYNTALRLSRQYNKLCVEVLDDAEFPFEADCTGSFESAINGDKEQMQEPGVYPQRWDTRELQLDAEYDISELSSRYGTVTLEVRADAVNLETAEISLLELRQIMDKAGLPFCSVELWVMSSEQNRSGNPVETLHILNFGWDDIVQQKLKEWLQEALAATDAYYGK